jgi:hypothetical protein
VETLTKQKIATDTDKNMAKRAIKILPILVMIAGILGCAGIYSRVMLPNNLILAEYERALNDLEHPLGTSQIATYGKVGWMEFPFPEACNFLIAEARLYSNTEEEIREFYNSYGLVLEDYPSISPAFQKIAPETEYHFEPLRLAFFDHYASKSCEDLVTLQWSLSSVCYWAKRKISQEKYYIVYVTSPGYDPGYDPRCNFAGW